MGNCIPMFKKKNRVFPGTTVSDTEISEILSRASSHASRPFSGSSREELEMIKALKSPDEDMQHGDMSDTDGVPEVKAPVFFQVDFVQGMPFRMPSRLAEKMNQKPEMGKSLQQIALTDEDEALMNDIMAEVEAKEKLEQIEEHQLAAQILREQRLETIREKARSMRSRPPTRVGQYGDEGDGDGGKGGGEGRG